MMSLSVSPSSLPLSSSAGPDFDALDRTVSALLVHRGFLKSAAPSGLEPSRTDAVASELGRLQATLAVVASFAAGGSVATALVRAYRWTIDTASHLADLEAELLDREVTPEDVDTFARRSATAFLYFVEPAFVAAGDSDTTSEERALLWDLETARVAIERVLLAIYELG